MVELVFDTGGRDVELKNLAVRATGGTSGAMRLGFTKTDALPVKACVGGPSTFRFKSMTDQCGRKLSDSEIVGTIDAAVRDGMLYADAVAIPTGEHASGMSLLAVNTINKTSGKRAVAIDLRHGPLPVRPVTPRMTVCLSDADEVRAAMQSVIRSTLTDDRCTALVSADAVSRFLTDALMENGAWLDIAYPSLGRGMAGYADIPYALERRSGSNECSFCLIRTPCSVKSLVDGIMKDTSCPKGKIRIRGRTSVETSLDYDGARILRQVGPFDRMKSAFVNPGNVSVSINDDGTLSYWDIRLD